MDWGFPVKRQKKGSTLTEKVPKQDDGGRRTNSVATSHTFPRTGWNAPGAELLTCQTWTGYGTRRPSDSWSLLLLAHLREHGG